MIKILSLSVLIFTIGTTQAKLLDKVAAVFNKDVITLSIIQRISDTLIPRREISPQLYSSTQMGLPEIVQLEINTLIIRKKLNEIGYIIGDEQVEAQIQSTEKRLGLTRDALLQFLTTKGLSFEEYFEITRATIEFNLFNARVIAPLITITEQDIKNTFFNTYASDKTLVFKYNLTDYSFSKQQLKSSLNQDEVTKELLKDLPKDLKNYQATGMIDKKYNSISVNILGDIGEDGLSKELSTVLKKTNEGDFSEIVEFNDEFHIFFVNKKDLVESQIYLEAKPKIKMDLFDKQAKQVTDVWYRRESNKHFIKILL